MALPVLIVWLVGRVQQNETNRKADIMLKAIESGATVDADLFRSQGSKTLKERLLGRLVAACVTSLLGVAFIVLTVVFAHVSRFKFDNGPQPFLLIIGGVLLAIGISLFVVYFAGKKMLAKEIEAEEKRLIEGK